MMTWVLVDLSWLAYRALHSVGDLEHEDIPTGIIFGVLTSLRHIGLDPRVRSNRIAIFCDSRSSLRSKTYPPYKNNRTDDTKEEDFLVQVRAMRKQKNSLQSEILPQIGFPVYEQAGLESDDLMALAAKQLSKAKHKAIMITSDGDLYQCITPHVHWFDPQRNAYHTEATFLEKKGIACHRWGEVKALSGCSSDNVEGILGVGELTAIRYLNGELPPRYKACQAITSGKGQRIAERNRGLVCLPHQATKPLDWREPTFQPEVFFRYCKQFGLESFLQEKQAWQSFFSGALFKTRKRGEK